MKVGDLVRVENIINGVYGHEIGLVVEIYINHNGQHWLEVLWAAGDYDGICSSDVEVINESR